jgi:hypothetical protein
MPALNFRGNAGFVVDGPGETYCLGSDIYPTGPRGGVGPLGWAVAASGNDRVDTIDRRLAGINYVSPGVAKVCRLDGITPGPNRIRVALGDANTAQSYQYLQLRDGGTTLLTIDKPAGNGAPEWYDATGVLRFGAADWVANNAPVDVMMAGTVLTIILGDASATGYSTLAHVSIEFLGTSGISSAILAALIEQGDL